MPLRHKVVSDGCGHFRLAIGRLVETRRDASLLRTNILQRRKDDELGLTDICRPATLPRLPR